MSEWSWVLIAVLVVVVRGRRGVGGEQAQTFRAPEEALRSGVRTHCRRARRTACRRSRTSPAREEAQEARHRRLVTRGAGRSTRRPGSRCRPTSLTSPQDAVGRAERLVTRVMRERGYPDRRLRSARRRHLRRPPGHRRQLPQCPRDLPVAAQRRHQHRGGAAGVRALPRPLRPTARVRDHDRNQGRDGKRNGEPRRQAHDHA